MQGPRHYRIAKSLIADGSIKTIADLFSYIPKSFVAKDLKIHYHTLLSKIENPTHFTLAQLIDLANFIEIDIMVLIGMAIHPSG